MTRALFVKAADMFCPLGMSLEAATAAMRAGLDHFRETEFTDFYNAPLTGAYIGDLPLTRLERQAYMFYQVVRGCLSRVPSLDMELTPLLLLTTEASRPDLPDDFAQELFAACTGERVFHEASRICAWGRAGLGLALPYAKKLLEEGISENVLIVGVDSLLYYGTLVYFSEGHRLIASGNSDGFHPSEGAGALVVCLEQKGQHGLFITGVGAAEEAGHYLQTERPNRAEGLTSVIRQAVAESDRPLVETDFHYSDCSGESFYFRESALALVRCLERTVPAYPHLVAGSTLGETGAAVGPLLLAHCSRLLGREDGFGRRALLHFSTDNGKRAAIIVEYR